jgi:hypothetical protein
MRAERGSYHGCCEDGQKYEMPDGNKYAVVNVHGEERVI